MKFLKSVYLRRLNKNTYNVRLFKGFFWNLLGDSFSKVLLMLTAVYIAKLLGPSDFGKWGVVQSTTMMFSIMLGFGIGVTSTKFISEHRTNDKVKAGVFLSLSLFFSIVLGSLLLIVMFFGAHFIAVTILKDISLVSVIKLSSMFLFFNSVNGVIAGSLVGLEKFKQIAIGNFFSGFLGAAIIVFFTMHYKLDGVVWGYTFYYFLADGFLIYFLIKEAKNQDIPFIFNITELKEEFLKFFNFSLAAFISAAIGGPAVWAVYAIVANYKNGFIYIGIFNLAKILQNAIIQFGAQLNSPLITLMGLGDASEHSEKMNFAVPWILITLIAFPFISVPEFFTYFLKGGKFYVQNIGLVVGVVAFTTYIILFKQGFARKIITGDLMWWGVWENVLWAIGIILMVLMFAKDLGVLGLPYAFALVYFIDLLILVPLYYKKKLIPKEIISWSTLIIWITVVLNLVVNYLSFPIVLRLIICLTSIGCHLLLIYNLFFKTKLNENIGV